MPRYDEFDAAKDRAEQMHASTPTAVSVHYDRTKDRIMIELNNGLCLGLPAHGVQGLEKATPSQLSEIEITPSGYGLHFPRLDADLYLPAVMAGVLGSKQWMAARLGQLGGRSRSKAKAAAARINGKRGGRPHKRLFKIV